MSLHDYSPGGRALGWAYGIIIGVVLFSGMGQMPILKRYYVTSLPLMAWAENFYTLSDLHYISVAFFLALMIWRLTLSKRILDPRWSWGPRTWWGWTLFVLLLISGTFMVARNFGIYISPPRLMLLDFIHLGSAMAFMLTGLVSLIRGRKEPVRQAG